MITTTDTDLYQILDFSTAQFMMFGIKSVSMDDLATKLGISKKTLYQHFTNKQDLVKKSLSRHVRLEENVIEEISHTANDAIDEMAQIAEHTVIHFRQIKPILIHDLQKYYRGIWQSVVLQQSQFIKTKIETNIKRGITEGYYRPELNSDIIAKLYVAKSFSLVDENLFSLVDYPRDVLVRQHILYHLNGILSDKGRKHVSDFNALNL